MATTATVAASAALPHDLIINILTRLPAKALCKFRCVSKQWLNLISDPYFVSLHHTRSRSNPNLLLVRSSPHDATDASNENLTLHITCSQMNSYSDHEFAVTIKESTVHMLPSRWDLVFFAGENAFYVCNPSIQEFFKLPHCSTCTSGEVNAGLGFNSATKEYVLVHLFDRSMDTYEYDIGIEVLRLSECRLGGSDSGSWKVVEGKNCPCQIRGWGVFVGNSFYWMIWDEFEQPGEEAIVCFDLDREEFGVVAAPKGCFDTEESIVPLDYRDGEILMDSNRESLEAYNVENKSFRRMSNRIEGNWTWLRLYTDSFFSLGSILPRVGLELLIACVASPSYKEGITYVGFGLMKSLDSGKKGAGKLGIWGWWEVHSVIVMVAGTVGMLDL
ncbi:F-box protein [Vitis vinifera]|uniref:F-box protein n=1 Tax=Vitis vinifera TaxID=29760 RepID=A0A438FI38_VITVI|nr:F-box protein [Vitis vinifera]